MLEMEVGCATYTIRMQSGQIECKKKKKKKKKYKIDRKGERERDL